MNKLVIGFHGHTGSGCTTAARQIAFRLDARRRSLADPIVAIADDFGISPLEMGAWKDHGIPWLGGMSPRTFVRLFGRGFRRALGAGFLATRVLDQVQRSEDRFTVVDDVRHRGEVAEFLPFDLRGGDNPAALHTLLVHVTRPGVPGDPGDDGDNEVDLANPAHFIDTIKNDGDVDDLRDQVDGLLDRLRFAHPMLRPPAAMGG